MIFLDDLFSNKPSRSNLNITLNLIDDKRRERLKIPETFITVLRDPAVELLITASILIFEALLMILYFLGTVADSSLLSSIISSLARIDLLSIDQIWRKANGVNSSWMNQEQV